MINKITITNIVASLVTVVGYFYISYSDVIMMSGLFALSGSITNWLAVHMLFEKIPLLYGSGIIPDRFEEFKSGIKNIILEEFFTREYIEKFFHYSKDNYNIDEKIDFDHVFEELVQTIECSPMGNMLNILGGRKVLQSLKEPIIDKLRKIIQDLVSNQIENEDKDYFSASIINQVEKIIDIRLQELTPETVKDILYKIIHRHLGWLVVWGGIFGGIIGFLVAIVK